MIVGLAIGWVLGIGTAILLLQFAAAALADDLAADIERPEVEPSEMAAAVDVAPFDHHRPSINRRQQLS